MASPRARTFAVALAATLAVAGGGAWLLADHISGSWQETLAWARAEQERYEGQDFTRPVLWGSARRGLAMIAYRHAVEVVRANREVSERVNRELHFRAADPAEQRAAVAVLAPALEALREGAHCTDARKPLDWKEGFSVEAANLLDLRTVANLATVRARLLLEEGEAIEAVRVLLDSAQLGRDLIQSPLIIDQMIGLALLSIAVRQTADPELVDALPEPALRELAAGLAVLDENLPVQEPAVHAETVLLVRHYENAAAGTPFDEDGFGFWKTLPYAFSNRWMLADAVAELIAFGEARARAGDRPWPEAERLLDAAATAARSSRNPMAAIAAPNLTIVARIRRETIAELRLLRTAVAHRLGDVLILDDPMGDGPLRLVEDEDGMYFRSAAVRMGKPLQRPVPR